MEPAISSDRSVVDTISDVGDEIVDIQEIGDVMEYIPPNVYSTSAVLNYCQRKMVIPYLRALSILGLRPLFADTTDISFFRSFLNKAHVLAVASFMIVGYILQGFTCYRRDRGLAYVLMTKTSSYSARESSDNAICQGSVFLCYVCPSLLHLSAFIYMVYLFRVTDNEHLQTLIEKVFLLSSSSHTSSASQRSLLKHLRRVIALALAWLLLALTIQLVIVLGGKVRFSVQIPHISADVQRTLVGIMVASTLWQDLVQGVIITNYCLECQLLTSYLHIVRARVPEKSMSLQDGMKELVEFQKLLKYLNQSLSPGATVLLLVAMYRVVSALFWIGTMNFWDRGATPSSVATVLLALQWSALALAPLIQATLLTSAARSLPRLAQQVRVRPFGFQDTSQQDLDSFVLLLSSFDMKATLIQVPVHGAMLCLTFFIAALWLLVQAHLPS